MIKARGCLPMGGGLALIYSYWHIIIGILAVRYCQGFVTWHIWQRSGTHAFNYLMTCLSSMTGRELYARPLCLDVYMSKCLNHIVFVGLSNEARKQSKQTSNRHCDHRATTGPLRRCCVALSFSLYRPLKAPFRVHCLVSFACSF